MENKEYTFTMTYDEARIAIIGLKKLPMENVENLITKLDSQFKVQFDAQQKEVAKAAEAEATQEEATSKPKRAGKAGA